MDAQPTIAPLLCPSARCEEGVALIGIIGPCGTVAYVDPALIVDRAFIEEARTRRLPEDRFRFAAPCQRSCCVHWENEKCGVVEQAHSANEGRDLMEAATTALPRCPIRPQCRWFDQRGPDACRVCPSVFNFVERVY